MMFGGVILMLLVDIWLMTEMYFGLNSSVSMLFAVVSAVKLLVLFPIGAFLGYLLSAKYKICIPQKST